MDIETINTMIATSHASVAHLASHFDTTPNKVMAFLKENGIDAPRAVDESFSHIQKLYGAERTSVADWEQFFWDDEEKRYINGIDTMTMDGRINANEILKFYHGDLKCWFTGEKTAAVTAFDGNPQLFLISNLIPIAEEVAKRRQFDQPVPSMVAGRSYGEPGGIEFDIKLFGRFDPVLHGVLNAGYIDQTVEQWVLPYFEHSPSGFLPEGITPSAETIALWLWRHLSTTAMVKGLAQVEVKYRGVSASMTKDIWFQVVMGLMKRAFESRSVVAGSGLVLPGQNRQMPNPGAVINP